MTVDVEHTEELKWWILGFGAKVAVLAQHHSVTR
jgi:hypothetical protein